MNTFRERLLKVCFEVMKPMAKCLLKCGIGYSEFSEISKRAFIDTAAKDFGIRGRTANVSRISAMTGISRREVKRVRDANDWLINTTTSVRSPAADILHFWHHDPSFRDAMGEPAPLPFEGGDVSFVSLARRYGGDRPPGALLKELIRVGAISDDGAGRLAVQMKHFVPSGSEEKLLLSMAQNLRALLTTICHNTSKAESEEGRIERFVYGEVEGAEVIAAFRKLARERIRKFTEEIDAELGAVECVSARHEAPSKTVGVGVYYFEGLDSLSEDDSV